MNSVRADIKLPPIVGLRVKCDNFWDSGYTVHGEVVETNGKYAIIKKDHDYDPNDWSYVSNYMQSNWEHDEQQTLYHRR